MEGDIAKTKYIHRCILGVLDDRIKHRFVDIEFRDREELYAEREEKTDKIVPLARQEVESYLLQEKLKSLSGPAEVEARRKHIPPPTRQETKLNILQERIRPYFKPVVIHYIPFSNYDLVRDDLERWAVETTKREGLGYIKMTKGDDDDTLYVRICTDRRIV